MTTPVQELSTNLERLLADDDILECIAYTGIQFSHAMKGPVLGGPQSKDDLVGWGKEAELWLAQKDHFFDDINSTTEQLSKLSTALQILKGRDDFEVLGKGHLIDDAVTKLFREDDDGVAADFADTWLDTDWGSAGIRHALQKISEGVAAVVDRRKASRVEADSMNPEIPPSPKAATIYATDYRATLVNFHGLSDLSDVSPTPLSVLMVHKNGSLVVTHGMQEGDGTDDENILQLVRQDLLPAYAPTAVEEEFGLWHVEHRGGRAALSDFMKRAQEASPYTKLSSTALALDLLLADACLEGFIDTRNGMDDESLENLGDGDYEATIEPMIKRYRRTICNALAFEHEPEEVFIRAAGYDFTGGVVIEKFFVFKGSKMEPVNPKDITPSSRKRQLSLTAESFDPLAALLITTQKNGGFFSRGDERDWFKTQNINNPQQARSLCVAIDVMKDFYRTREGRQKFQEFIGCARVGLDDPSTPKVLDALACRAQERLDYLLGEAKPELAKDHVQPTSFRPR